MSLDFGDVIGGGLSMSKKATFAITGHDLRPYIVLFYAKGQTWQRAFKTEASAKNYVKKISKSKQVSNARIIRGGL